VTRELPNGSKVRYEGKLHPRPFSLSVLGDQAAHDEKKLFALFSLLFQHTPISNSEWPSLPASLCSCWCSRSPRCRCCRTRAMHCRAVVGDILLEPRSILRHSAPFDFTRIRTFRELPHFPLTLLTRAERVVLPLLSLRFSCWCYWRIPERNKFFALMHVFRFVLYQVRFNFDIQLLQPVPGAAALCLDFSPIVRLGAAEDSHVRPELSRILRHLALPVRTFSF
jgi:hypothetical protein